MLSELASIYPLVNQVFDEASEILAYDLWELVQNNPDEALNKTEITQPALLTSSIAIWRVWEAEGGESPTLFAGHSLGEYSALVCAGVIAFADAVELVKERGRLMQEAVNPGDGAMAAILGLDDEIVEQVCNQAGVMGVVTPANYNSPGQLVIAGECKAVEHASQLAKEAGAKRALLLPVSVPSHCALMLPAADKFISKLDEVNFQEAHTAIIQNVDVEIRTDAKAIKASLLRQLHEPVRWTQSIRKMAAEEVTDIVECGPGKILAGLIKRIDRSLQVYPVFDSTTLQTALTRE